MKFSVVVDAGKRLKDAIIKHRELSIIVSLLFTARLFLSNQQSYWLDEHYSVWAYGSYYANPFEMGYYFARQSVHPPLYQGTLWLYMKIFGDSEIATRTLSNIFILLATIAIYFLIKDFLPKWFALLVTAVYGGEPSSILYGDETRSYALTLAFSVIALLALRRFIQASDGNYRRRWWQFCLTIAGLMLTHYYNMFLVGAFGAYLLTEIAIFNKDKKVVKRNVAAVKSLLIGVLIYVVLWGVIFYIQFFMKKGKYAGVDKLNIFNMYDSMLVGLNLNSGSLIIIGLVYIAAAIGLVVFITQLRKRQFKFKSFESIIIQFFYLTFLPILASYAAFVAIDASRQSTRYYIYSAALLPVFMMLVFYWAIQKWVKTGKAARLRTIQVAVATAFTLFAIVPQSVAAANDTKIDWRGTISFASQWAEQNYPGGVNVVEVSFRPQPMSAYYLGKNNYQPLSLKTVQKMHDATAVPSDYSPMKLGITKDKPLLILYLVHPEGAFKNLTAGLDEYYQVVERYIDLDGHGFEVYVPKQIPVDVPVMPVTK